MLLDSNNNNHNNHNNNYPSEDKILLSIKFEKTDGKYFREGFSRREKRRKFIEHSGNKKLGGIVVYTRYAFDWRAY